MMMNIEEPNPLTWYQIETFEYTELKTALIKTVWLHLSSQYAGLNIPESTTEFIDLFRDNLNLLNFETNLVVGEPTEHFEVNLQVSLHSTERSVKILHFTVLRKDSFLND